MTANRAFNEIADVLAPYGFADITTTAHMFNPLDPVWFEVDLGIRLDLPLAAHPTMSALGAIIDEVLAVLTDNEWIVTRMEDVTHMELMERGRNSDRFWEPRVRLVLRDGRRDR